MSRIAMAMFHAVPPPVLDDVAPRTPTNKEEHDTNESFEDKVEATVATPEEINESCEGLNILVEYDRDPFGDVSQGGINLDIDPLGGVSACGGDGEGVLPSENATSNDGPADVRDGPVAVLDGLMPMGPALGLQMRAVPRCRLCHGPLDPLEKGVKAFRKVDTFQCKQCCCKWSGRSREFGEWPTDEFEGCAEEEQLHLW